MRITLLIVVMAVLSSPAFSQPGYPWQKVDTVTTGEYDDYNPVLFSQGHPSGYSQGLWLLFERHSESESNIAGLRLNTDTGKWDSIVTIIARSPSTVEQLLPDYSHLTYYTNYPNFVSHDVSIAAWQRRTGGVWNIYYSRLTDRDSIWSESQALTVDSVSNTNVHVRGLEDSTFLVTWKRKNILSYSLVTPSAISLPETLAVSSSERFKYDITTTYPEGRLVWTSVDSAGGTVMLARSIDTYPTLSFSPPETLLTIPMGSNPHIVQGWSTTFYGVLLFDAGDVGKRDVYAQYKNYGTGPIVENLSNDSLADDFNARAYSTPFITIPGRYAGASSVHFDAIAMEKNRGNDSLLFVRSPLSYFYGDTIRSAGHNRNACIGSVLFPIPSTPYIYVAMVWESNRTGRSHIYGKLIPLPTLEVKEKVSNPTEFQLFQNYPNPFNPGTVIGYRVSGLGFVTLKVYDILGREVATLVNEVKQPGTYTVQFSAKSGSASGGDGSGLASGVYIYRLSANGQRITRKMILMK